MKGDAIGHPGVMEVTTEQKKAKLLTTLTDRKQPMNSRCGGSTWSQIVLANHSVLL